MFLFLEKKEKKREKDIKWHGMEDNNQQHNFSALNFPQINFPTTHPPPPSQTYILPKNET